MAAPMNATAQHFGQAQPYHLGETIDGRTYRIHRHPWRESFGAGAWFIVEEQTETPSFLDEPLTTEDVNRFFVNEPFDWRLTSVRALLTEGQ